MHAETGATRGACRDDASWSRDYRSLRNPSSGNDSGRASPTLACRKSPIYHLHENALDRLGSDALSWAVTPRSVSSKLPADACMVMPAQEELEDTSVFSHFAAHGLCLGSASPSSSSLLSPSVRAHKPSEEEEEVSAFEEHLLRAAPTRRSNIGPGGAGRQDPGPVPDGLEPTRRNTMPRNNACLDLGVLGRRAAALSACISVVETPAKRGRPALPGFQYETPATHSPCRMG